MKKLEDISKEDIFRVPDGYFENLPTIIQSRITKRESNWMPALRLSLKYALPVMVISVGSFWFFKAEPKETPDQLLASVNSVDLAEYIHELDMTTEELLESLDYSQINADSLDLNESHVSINQDDLSDLLNELDTEL